MAKITAAEAGDRSLVLTRAKIIEGVGRRITEGETRFNAIRHTATAGGYPVATVLSTWVSWRKENG